jgi:hypothetical protein
VVQEALGALGDQQGLETLGDQVVQVDHVYREHPAICTTCIIDINKNMYHCKNFLDSGIFLA